MHAAHFEGGPSPPSHPPRNLISGGDQRDEMHSGFQRTHEAALCAPVSGDSPTCKSYIYPFFKFPLAGVSFTTTRMTNAPTRRGKVLPCMVCVCTRIHTTRIRSHPGSGRSAPRHSPRFREANAEAARLEASSPLALICGLFCLLQLLQGCGQSLLSPVQLLLNKLDASIESGHISFGLGR